MQGWKMPDLTPLVYFGIFGMAVAALMVAAVVMWGGYHLVMAVSQYVS